MSQIAITNQAWSLCRFSGGHGRGRNGLADRPYPTQPHGSPRCEMFFNIDFLDKGHCRSGRSVHILCGLYWIRKG
jgi:hypothetical protein